MKAMLHARFSGVTLKGGRAAFVLCFSMFAGAVGAEPGGISFASGSPGAGNCTGCHTSPNLTPYNYSASLTASSTVIERNASTSITFSITRIGSSPIPKDTGLNVASPGGGALSESSSLLQLMVGENGLNEITHVVPQPSNSLIVGGSSVGAGYAWPNFTWTAPNISGPYTLYACGNLVDGNRQNPLDGSGWTGDNPTCDTLSITVNNAPVINAAGTSIAHTEQIAVTVDSVLSLTDTENNSMSSATITISGNYSAASGDRLIAGSCPTGLSCSGSNTQTVTITGTDTLADYQTAFRNISFNTTSDNPGTLTRTVQFSVTDTFGRTRSDTRTVTVAAVNDAPVLSGVDGTPIYVEDTNPGVIIDGDITVTDPDSANCDLATVDLSTNYQSTEDLLEVTDTPPAGITIVGFDSGTGTLTLSGTAACADYATALESVRYRNTSLNPDTALRTVVFQVRDSSTDLSNTSSTTITVQDLSTPPTIGGVDGTVIYVEDTSPGVIVDSDITVTDPDSANCNQATIDLSTGYQPGEDLLEYTGSVSGISAGVFNASTGTLTLAGTAACADYAGALANVRYRNTSQSPDTTNRTVEFQVSDSGNSLSNIDSKTISVTATNDAPVAVDDSVNVPVNSTDNPLNPLANDSDPDTGDTLTIVDVGVPDNGGSVVIGSPCAANTLCYTPAADFTGIETFSYVVEDPLGAQDTATITVSGTDTDGDGVIDFLDNCPNDVNAGQEDNDTDGQGDACDSDDDNDGMSDTFETTHGLDPMNPADADQDPDGDGRTNLEEFLAGGDPNADDVGPEFEGAEDIAVDSTGYFTPVTLNVVTANDAADGKRAVNIHSVVGTTGQAEVEKGLFRPGRTVITYSATDAGGNNSLLEQAIDVRPLANLLPNQVAVEGGAATIGISLNGEAVTYPVTFDYTVSGTAGSGDHDAADGSVSIDAGTSAAIVVNLIDDGIMEGSETLVITLSNPQNAVLGNKTGHTVVINEGNIAPAVTLNVAQAANTGSLITQDGGTVTMTAAVSDLNAGDAFTYDWSQMQGFLVALNGTGGSDSGTFEFDPAVLEPGVYESAVAVTDSGSPAATTSVRIAVNLKASSPVLDPLNDSDSDGIDDVTEGYQDIDGNGIADYLDPFSSAAGTNLIPNQTGELPKMLPLQTDAGLKLRMGAVGLSTEATGALVGPQNVENYVNQSGGSPTLPKDAYRNVGGIFDFEVHGLPVGEAANVVLPLSAGILLDAEYRKFDLQNGWRSFVTNANNIVMSAPSVNGACPAPGSDGYITGLNPFHGCVQLTIQDGGPNDADGEANGVIRDPGGVGVADVTPAHETPEPDDGSGGGTLHPLWLLLLAGLLAASGRRGKWLH